MEWFHLNDLLLGLIALLTSTVAGVFGLGGGMLLIAVLPVFLPPGAVIPVHGLTQLVSNSSRSLFAIRSVAWFLMPRFIAGSMAGALLFGFLITEIPSRYIPLAIGVYILLNVWTESFKRLVEKFESFLLAGFLQTGLGLIVGATGPLTMSLLLNHLGSREQIVATAALMMTFSHLVKIILYGWLGFNYLAYTWALLFLFAGAVLGSYVGTRIRWRIENQRFKLLLAVVLSILALRMIVFSLSGGL